ncbi:unnamed protein product [Angiostrongylus costaricensis]|uniref:C2H2-type domain-containing protein n=1 Tax=Angiostrongylus costaricensis TaxID=334426 RepID=A0A0R3PTT4_ANGCS|nr:unnamed protein product [Angiostrongylus costaricensis]
MRANYKSVIEDSDQRRKRGRNETSKLLEVVEPRTSSRSPAAVQVLPVGRRRPAQPIWPGLAQRSICGWGQATARPHCGRASSEPPCSLSRPPVPSFHRTHHDESLQSCSRSSDLLRRRRVVVSLSWLTRRLALAAVAAVVAAVVVVVVVVTGVVRSDCGYSYTYKHELAIRHTYRHTSQAPDYSNRKTAPALSSLSLFSRFIAIAIFVASLTH